MLQGKLTSREKIMLFCLFCFLIVILGLYFGVKPARENCNKLQQDYETLEQEYNMMLSIKNSYEDRVATMQQQTKALDAITSKYFLGLDSADLDDITTSWVTGSGLTVRSLIVGSVTYNEQIIPANPEADAQYGVANVSHVILTWDCDIDTMKPVLDRIESDGRFALRSMNCTFGTSRSQAAVDLQAICLASVEDLETAQNDNNGAA